MHKTLIYEFPSEDEKAQIKLSIFINPSQDIRRSKSIEVFHPETNFVWKIDNPQIYEDNKKNYFGHSALTVPANFDFPEGLFELTYFDVADRIKLYYSSDEEIKETFDVFGEYIKDETLSLELIEKEDLVETFDINGHDVKIDVEKN